MTKFITTIALAVLVASPAFADRADGKPRVRHGKLFLQAAPAPVTNPSVGWDPDPNIRLRLQKDAPDFY